MFAPDPRGSSRFFPGGDFRAEEGANSFFPRADYGPVIFWSWHGSQSAVRAISFLPLYLHIGGRVKTSGPPVEVIEGALSQTTRAFVSSSLFVKTVTVVFFFSVLK